MIALDFGRPVLSGRLAVPGDKSISHRAIMLGAMAEGTTTIRRFLPGDDCLATIDCLSALGVSIERNGTEVRIDSRGYESWTEPARALSSGNSGTTARLLLGLLAGRPFHCVVTGDDSLAARPMARVVSPLREMGARIDGRGNGAQMPLAIRGGRLAGRRFSLPIASAQVKSAILLAGLQADGTTAVEEPSPSRDHTERMLPLFGAEIRKAGRFLEVPGAQRLTGAEVDVPGDISSAAFFLVAGACAAQADIRLDGVGLNPTRTGILDALTAMGADVRWNASMRGFEPVGSIEVRSSTLRGTEIGGALIPRIIDELPALALLATQAQGTTIIRDAAELRLKETDRIAAVADALGALGASIVQTSDGMVIKGPVRLRGGAVETRGDHRIAMMGAIAALFADGPVSLDDASCIAVSYPRFFEDLASLIPTG